MKPRILFLGVLLSFLAISGYSQAEKIKIAVVPFSFNETSVSEGEALSVTEMINTQFIQTHRFTVVDRSTIEQILKEKTTQRTGDFIDGEVVEMSRSLGAQFLISGHVGNISVSKVASGQVMGSTTYSYKSSVTIQIKVIDVVTTEVIASENLVARGSANTSDKSKQEALLGSATNGGIAKDIRKFIAKQFPIELKIQEIQDTKGGAARIVLLLGGSSVGVAKNDKMEVKAISQVQVGDKMLERKTQIGIIKVTEVQDEYFSLGKVIKGGEEILQAFNAGEKILCFTYTNK